MEIIPPKNVDLDMNSNVYKESGYWQAGGNKAGRGTDLGAEFVDLYDSESPELSATVRSVSLHLEQCLRAAKKAHLSCGEVLLPPDLLTRVARDIIRMAETEPCGLRGGLILINFENGSSASGQNKLTSSSPSSNSHQQRKDLHSSNSSLNSTSSSGSSDSGSTASSQGSSSASVISNKNARNIGRVRWDAQTVTTFELHLTLREDPTPWYSRLPQILRNLTKGGTIVVSPAYTIAKKKLYRSH